MTKRGFERWIDELHVFAINSLYFGIIFMFEIIKKKFTASDANIEREIQRERGKERQM